MKLEYLVAELEFKYPQLKKSFGTIENFINNLNNIYNVKTANYLTELLNFKGKLVIIDPVQYRFTLYSGYENLYLESVIYEEPYSIYNAQRELLYSVSSHYGVFGNSILDGLLNVDFRPGSLFYLDYSTYSGKQQLILVTGLIPVTTDKKIGLTKFTPSTLTRGEDLNQLQFKLTSGQQNMTKLGLPFYPVKVYYLETSSPVLLSRMSVVNSSLTRKDIYDLELSNLLLINPTAAGWLAFNQVTNTGEIPLSINNITGGGVDRLITAAPNLYYLAIDSNINMNLFKQAFNLDNVDLPDFDSFNGLNIKADLSN